MAPAVSLVKCSDYQLVENSIKKSLDLLGGINKFIKNNEKVLLKPNLLDPFTPDKAATTHPLFVKAVIELVKEITPNIFVGDCSGGNVTGATKRVYRIAGIKELVDETGVVFKDLQEDEFVYFNVNNVKYGFSKFSLNVDAIINMPKLKTHGITFMTGCVKNMFGCVNHDTRQMAHRDAVKDVRLFGKHLLNIYNRLKPRLNIMDAIVGMEGDEGPSYGNPKKIGLVLASEDGIALDAVAAKVTGHNPLAIPTIGAAYTKKDIDGIETLGEILDEVKVHDFKHHTLFRNPHKKKVGFGREFILQPVINKVTCKKCKVCIKSCPVDAIHETDGETFVVIDSKKCIRCYCCQEVCEYRAIELKKVMLNKRLAPYIEDNKLITKDKELDVNLIKFDVNKINNLDMVLFDNNKLNLISLKLSESDLNRETGAKILSLLNKLNEKKINYLITKPLFQCVSKFNLNNKLSTFNFPLSCEYCLGLFTFEGDLIKLCSGELIENKNIINRKQLVQYLITRENVPYICMRCLYYRRNQCIGVCNNYKK